MPEDAIWTLRDHIEHEFRGLGFRSHKIKHKNEPVHRLADSLLLTWHHKNSTWQLHTNIEVRVTFIGWKTTYHIIRNGRLPRACMYQRIGKTTFTEDFNGNPELIFSYVRSLIEEER